MKPSEELLVIRQKHKAKYGSVVDGEVLPLAAYSIRSETCRI